ncbi:MAG: hypothetical protein HKN73_17100 [Gemmatimonadetes bacterium]|nr:hypothetical protein [Gemmatimonadota bacterium]
MALTAGEVAVHFVPLVSPNAPHGGIGFGVHRERGGSIPLGTARLADDGTDLTVEVAISGLIPHPGEYSDSYTLRLRGHAEAGTTPLDCNGRPHVGTVFSEESSDADGEIQGTFQVVGRSLSEVGALMLLWDEMPLACGPVRGS